MKKYIKPNMRVADIEVQCLIADSPQGGVATGQSLGDDFDENDVSYSRDNNNLWDQEW